MFAINSKPMFTSLITVLLIIFIFSNWAVAPVDKIDPAVLAAAQAGGTIPVIIRLQDQPGHEIAQAVKAQFYPSIEAIAREIRNKIRPFRQQGQPLPLNIEREVKALRADLDNVTHQMRREIRAQIWNRIAGGQQRVREAIENAGGTVHAQIAVINAIGARLLADAVNQIALLPEVRWIERETEEKPNLDSSEL